MWDSPPSGSARQLLTAQVQDGRGLLRQILTGPIQFTPVKQGARRGYAFRGEVSAAVLLAGFVDVTMMASPTGSATFPVIRCRVTS